VLFFVAIALAATIPVGFQAVPNRNYVYLAIEGAPGATREDMSAAVQKATQIIRREPDVETVFAQIGSTSGGFGGGGGDLTNGTLTVVLKHDRRHTSEEFQALIGPELRAIPEARFHNQGNFGQAAVSLVLAGQDGAALERTQMQLLREMRGLRSISDPRPSPPAPGPELIVTPRPAEAARLNVDSRSLANVLRIATIGDIDASVAKYPAGEQLLPIRVRLPESARNDLETLSNLRVPTLDGKTTPLSSVADIKFQSGPGKIIRFDRERRVAVDADLAVGAVIGSALQDIRKLPTMQHLPPGIHEAQQGTTQQIAELFVGFILALIAGIGLTFTVLVLLFRGFFKPVVIMGALPLSMIGAFAALKIGGFALEAERAGASMRDALIEACAQRTRPIIMTSVAMIAGMLPTAFAVSEGSESRQPMAVAVIGGMLTSTALSLFLVPVIYEIIDRFEMRIVPKLGRLVTSKRPGDDDPIPDETAPAPAH
jgi:HAE1 family hydrophobic/amphiphilic exporter-1